MPILDYSTQKKMIAKPIYPRWALILQIVAMVVMIGAWIVEYFYPSLTNITDKVDYIAWMVFLLMLGHQWGFNKCLKSSRFKY